jgi:imidazolonepropionase-like amidohydrolase
VGTLMPGKRADLTVFEGDLGDSQDLADLGARLRNVFQSGNQVLPAAAGFLRDHDVSHA